MARTQAWCGAVPCRGWWRWTTSPTRPTGRDLRGVPPPAAPLGRSLATAHRRDAALTGAGRRLMEVGLLIPTEAGAHLAEALAVHDRAEPDDQLATLATLATGLDHLPPALSQAAAYLADAAPDTLPDDQNHTTTAACPWPSSNR